MADITLTLLTGDDREKFIQDNQRAFKYGAMEEFGVRDERYEEDEEIISRKTIEESIDKGVAYRIREDGRSVGGVVLNIRKHGSGKPARRILRPETFTFMSISAASILSNSSTTTIQIPMIRELEQKNPMKKVAGCSVLKSA